MSFKILLSVIKCPDCTGAAVTAATCRQVFLICFDCLQGRHGDQVCSSNRGCPLINEFCKVPVAIIATLWLEACWQNRHPPHKHRNPSFPLLQPTFLICLLMLCQDVTSRREMKCQYIVGEPVSGQRLCNRLCDIWTMSLLSV